MKGNRLVMPLAAFIGKTVLKNKLVNPRAVPELLYPTNWWKSGSLEPR
jgi:hypothetical protein